MPGNEKLLIFGPFPVGKYEINIIKSIGLSDSNVRADKFTDQHYVWGNSFEIKPNQVTLLNKKFTVRKTNSGSGRRWRQTWFFETINATDKTEIVQQIARLENSEAWILPPSISPEK